MNFVLYSSAALVLMIVCTLAQDSGFRQIVHRRNFDRDGLLISASLVNNLGIPGQYSPEGVTISPEQFISSRNFGMPPSHGHSLSYSPYVQQSEPMAGPSPLMMLLAGGAHDTNGPYSGMGYMPYSSLFGNFMSPHSFYQNAYPRMGAANYYYGANPKIEIGQKLSNSIYANSDTLRYDLSSMKDYRNSPYSSSLNQYAHQQQHQQPHHAHHSNQALSYSTNTPSTSTYQSSDYVYPVSGYRYYVSQMPQIHQASQALGSQLYSRIVPYSSYLANKHSSASSNIDQSNKVPATDPKEEYSFKSSKLSPSHTSSTSSSDTPKLFKASSVKEELGFFKRNDSKSKDRQAP